MESGTQTDGSISIRNTTLKKATEYKYLCSTLSCDGNVTPEVRARIKAAWAKWRQVIGVLCDRRMSRRLKSKIYRTVVRPMALYEAECWPAIAVTRRPSTPWGCACYAGARWSPCSTTPPTLTCGTCLACAQSSWRCARPASVGTATWCGGRKIRSCVQPRASTRTAGGHVVGRRNAGSTDSKTTCERSTLHRRTLKTAPGGGRPLKQTLRLSGNIARTKKKTCAAQKS